ncbi:MAG: gephyrin-like molybdotransferase Glp [Syntrophobacteria bacterium]
MEIELWDRETRVSLQEAQQHIRADAVVVDGEWVPLGRACGRVLAEAVGARRDEPASPRAAVDGYAVRSRDVEAIFSRRDVALSVVGTMNAGQLSPHEVRQGEAVRVATGAVMPGGADAVVPHEVTETAAEGIRVRVPVAPGNGIVPAGAEFHRDQHLVAPGTALRPVELTVLAIAGCARVRVRRRPRVAVLATGDELVELEAMPGPEKVVASNLYTVVHLVKSCGGKAIPLGIVRDSLGSVIRAIEQGMEADVLVTTGGTGKGNRDLISAAVAAVGGCLRFQGVAISPGKQSLFGRLGRTLLFGLPGRPSATHIAFEQLVRPALLGMLGVSRVTLPETGATLSHSIRVKGNVHSFLHSRLRLGPHGSQVRVLRSEATQGMLTGMLGANALLKVPPGRENLDAGERVQVQLLDLDLGSLSYFSLP